ncbi:MAG: hypothetical protein HUU16_08760, partial [Candidatus Omnitrophica bacterium]|nr:hypothetical protein [Candidatus Omnitrophota bacterium]
MKKHLIVLTVLALATFAPSGYAATILVPSAHATLQAAINAAAAGDIIEIENSATYNEDLFIEGPSALPGNKNGLTIRAAAGQNPTIVATNTVAANNSGGAATLFQRGIVGLIQFNFLGGNGNPGVGAADHKGLIVEANNVTLQGLNIQNPSTTGDPTLNSAAAVTILGNNTVFQNCIIQGAPVSSNDLVGALTVAFNGPVVNAVLSGALNGTGYETTPLPVTGTQFLNCTLQNTDIAYASVDYGHALLLLNGPVYSEPLVSTTTFDTCEFFGNDDVSQAANGATTNINCNFHNNTDAYTTEGNSSTFTDCTFSSKVGNNELVNLS